MTESASAPMASARLDSSTASWVEHAHVDGHAASDLLDHKLGERDLLVGGANVEFTVGPKGEDAAGPLGDELLDQELRSLVANGLGVIPREGGDHGDDDALELGHAWIPSLLWSV